MTKKFRVFLLSLDFGIKSGDIGSLQEFLEDYSLQGDFGTNPEEFYKFFLVFDQLVEYKEKMEFMITEVSRLN